MDRRAIIILGMHRSGTSALTGVFGHLGVHPGRVLQPASRTANPKGFWEPVNVVSLDDELLQHLDSSWDDARSLPDNWLTREDVQPFRDKLHRTLSSEYDGHRVWVVKDPRMCRLVPLWHQVLSQMNCDSVHVLCLRHPAAVAGSLRRRDGLMEPESCLLWLAYVLDAERHTRLHQRAMVSYEDLLADWRHLFSGLADQLDLTWPKSMDEAGQAIDAFLERALDHHETNMSLPDHPACALAVEAHQLLTNKGIDREAIDELRSRLMDSVRYADWLPSMIGYRREMRRRLQQSRIEALENENNALSLEVERMRSTVSWQVTKPLRLIANLPRLFGSSRGSS